MRAHFIIKMSEVTMAFTENTKVKDVLANKKAVEILEKNFPGVTKNPFIGMFANRTLKDIASIPQLNIDKETFEKLLAAINAEISA